MVEKFTDGWMERKIHEWKDGIENSWMDGWMMEREIHGRMARKIQ